MGKYTREMSIQLLIDKKKRLEEAGENRFPQRSDFSDEEVCAVKAFLGPWPRALEAAGIKEVRNDDRKRLNSEKRIRAKRRRTEAKKVQKQAEKNTTKGEQ
ncbi:MAG: hypothetical protein IJS80_01950 [Lachnospiraceae bacterium]|nr:hypothetical protein [Lachnospiraceae bacterium]